MSNDEFDNARTDKTIMERIRKETPNKLAVAFFYKHAGWGYDPKKETARQGRMRGARELARAELWARHENMTFDWQPDWSVGSHVKEFDTYDVEPTTCEVALAFDADGRVIASLGCIDDADANYRRVVNAELALEVMPA